MADPVNDLLGGVNAFAQQPEKSTAQAVTSQLGNQSLLIAFIVIMIILIFIFLGIIIWQILKYNKIIHIHKLIDNHYVEYSTKGGIFKDKNKIPFLRSTVFGRDGDKISNQRVPSGEYWENKMCKIGGLFFMPYTIKESIHFLLINGNYIPIKPNFVTLQRGQNLKVSDLDDCDFCKYGIDSYEFMMEKDRYINEVIPKIETDKNIKLNLETVCKKCYSNIINAKYECVDVADKAWYFKTLEDNKNRYGDFLTKFMPAILIAAFLIFTIIYLFIVLQSTPKLIETQSNAYINQYNQWTQGQQHIYNITAPPTN